MSATTYSPVQTPRKRIECHDCGANADVQFVADRLDPETGDQDQIALCRQCLAKRERR